jgi:DNA invertase Pin-like site-specific DNA recombinase
MLIGYARVSKKDKQDTLMQMGAFKEARVARVFEEKATGGRWDRPELHRMLEQLRKGDVVVVWKLDRLSRSLRDLLLIMDKIAAAGAGFKSLTEAVDTTSPAGPHGDADPRQLRRVRALDDARADARRARGCARTGARRWAPTEAEA